MYSSDDLEEPDLTEISFSLSFFTLGLRNRRGREASLFLSVHEVSDGLRKAGYIADSVAITTVFLASSLHRPVFSEGPAGSGKTQLAYAVAQAANTCVERLQCYEGIGEDKAIGKFDESLQRLCVELKSKASGIDWELLKNELHGEHFFSAGPLLRALLRKPSTAAASSSLANAPTHCRAGENADGHLFRHRGRCSAFNHCQAKGEDAARALGFRSACL